MGVFEKLGDKEKICDEAEETLETFNEDEYFKQQKEFFKRNFERDQLRKKQRELSEKARKEVLKELGEEDTEDEPSPLLRRCPETSEVSDEDYKQLVDDINRLVARNVQIIAIMKILLILTLTKTKNISSSLKPPRMWIAFCRI